MSTTPDMRAARPMPDEAHGFFDDGFCRRFDRVAEPEPDDSDDVWPLEMWLSREEELVEGDTWHAARARSVGSHAGGILRSLIAPRRRVAWRNPVTH